MKKTPPSPTVPNGPELSSDLALSSSPRIFTREELEAIAFTTPLVLVDLVLALSAQNQDLLTRTSSLEEQLAKNSRNSSKPPYALASGDGPVSVDRIAPYPGDYSPALANGMVRVALGWDPRSRLDILFGTKKGGGAQNAFPPTQTNLFHYRRSCHEGQDPDEKRRNRPHSFQY